MVENPGKGWLRVEAEDRPLLSTHPDPQTQEVAWGSGFSIVETAGMLGVSNPIHTNPSQLPTSEPAAPRPGESPPD